MHIVEQYSTVEEPAKDTAAWLDLKGVMLKGKKEAN